MVVELADRKRLLTPAQAMFVARHAEAAGVQLGLEGELRMRVVDDAEMDAIHRRFSGVAGTTDVLTFDLRDEQDRAAWPRCMDVDVILCADEAGRAAAARGHAIEHELLLYALHGVLHCLGHDDHDDAAYAAMHRLEDEVLAAIGVGPVFGVSVSDGEGAR